MNVSGLSSAALKRLYAKTGDAGDVAFEAKSNIRTLIPHPPLLITALYDSLLKIAHAKGQGAVKQKQAIVEKLLVAAKGEEVRFYVRTLSQHIRVGAVRTSILTALARAMVLTPPSSLTVLIADDSPHHASLDLISQVKAITMKNMSKKVVDEAKEELIVKFTRAESLIKKVFVQHPNYDHMVVALLDAGLDGLSERVPLTVGVYRLSNCIRNYNTSIKSTMKAYLYIQHSDLLCDHWPKSTNVLGTFHLWPNSSMTVNEPRYMPGRPRIATSL